MTARILVVDDVAANVRLLEARLQLDYFDVRTALSGEAALEIASRERLDLILLDVMMPGLSGFDVCKALKNQAETADIPIIMVTALDSAEDKVKGLRCGADDFLTKPVSEIELLTRVRSLVRLKSVTDELNLRAAAMQSVGVDTRAIFTSPQLKGSRILVVDDRESSTRHLRKALGRDVDADFVTTAPEALAAVETSIYDLLIVSLSLSGQDGLRLCSQIKSIDHLRYVPILIVTDPDESAKLRRALEFGINDYIVRPLDEAELRARVTTQLRRKRYSDRLRSMVTNAVELAITDPLTGLHNRRYLDSHLVSLLSRSVEHGKPVSILLFDIDFFKSINDRYGHDAGDDVLREFSTRLRKGVRGIDLIVRFGGEEFLVVMPETGIEHAVQIAERLRGDVEAEPFTTREGQKLPVTVSIGLSRLEGPEDTPGKLIKRADKALYEAKAAGRNRVAQAA
ncbi:two-component system cell cycle response regulator [Rhodopseudomonas julia]|uniref:diguanylate cyclase n=1 Tax=Rhodopseudomonas julia TaxID=200617 RepID=A0ABU0CAN1_9BRAD|nr:PleD family two-component system response regulator [Rhodopseudomonas julia]MDQ0327257.1 two-component system cell cycle response regulator [Rhodopseudomonas julia]